MNKLLPLVTFVAFVLVILVTFLYGLVALLFPFFLVSGFFASFAVMSWNAQFQAVANPGIEKIEEPDWFFSPIYNAWLYATDIESWAQYATIISLIAAAILGSLFGFICLSMAQATSSRGISESWLAGMFLTCLIAIDVMTADYWAKQSKKKASKVSNNQHALKELFL